jgi:hypothetical protein
MRDRRFIAAHRGGPLDEVSHRLLARWAADCAKRVLPLFTRWSDDVRPSQAIAIAREWAKGKVKTGAAMKASVAAHAAARQVKDRAAIAAARSAAQAVATAHFADHCLGALLYAMKALTADGRDADVEMDLQLAKLPDQLREPVASGVKLRLNRIS